MFKRVASAILGLVTLCFPLFAEGRDPDGQAGADGTASEAPPRVSEVEADPAIILYRPGIFDLADGSSLLRRRPALRHFDGAPLSVLSGSGGLGMAQIDQFPSLREGCGGVENARLSRVCNGPAWRSLRPAIESDLFRRGSGRFLRQIVGEVQPRRLRDLHHWDGGERQIPNYRRGELRRVERRNSILWPLKRRGARPLSSTRRNRGDEST